MGEPQPTRIELVERLLHPKSVTIVGASPRPGSWSEAVYRNLRRFKYPHPVYLVNPGRTEVFGEICYPSFDALPSYPDHVAVAVPKKEVAGVLRAGAAAGARSATVYASGFGEEGDRSLEAAEVLKATIIETGLAVSGPNCLGNISAPARLVTATDRHVTGVGESNVALVGQSGGVVLYMLRALRSRGNAVAYAITSGNELGLTMADYLAYLVEEPNVKVIGAFIEAVRDLEGFVRACRRADEVGKTVVALKIGGSDEGRKGALAHTGAIVGSLDAFDAVCRDVGVVRVDTLDQIVEAIEFLGHTSVPAGPGIGAIVYSGGLRELLLEASARHGVAFPALSESSIAALEQLLPVGCFVGNPLDCGFGGLSSEETYFRCVDILLADEHVGVLLAQETPPTGKEDVRTESYVRGLDRRAQRETRKPIAIFTMVSEGLSPYGLKVRRSVPHVPVLQEVDRAFSTAARLVAHGVERQQRLGSPTPVPEVRARRSAPPPVGRVEQRVLSEVESKRVLERYGIAVMPEEHVASSDDVVEAVARLGAPVVLKGVAAGVVHKSELGLVVLGLRTGEEALIAAREIEAHARDAHLRLEGLIVAKQAPHGHEVVLGVKRDPEVGAVVLFGAGGLWVELYGDVALAALPITREKARRLVERTKVAKILAGYRTGRRFDVEAVVSALVGLGELAEDWGPAIQEIDINPFVVLEGDGGGYALDAVLVVAGG